MFEGLMSLLLHRFPLLQVLKRKPDLYGSEGLDIRVVFYCGESPCSAYQI